MRLALIAHYNYAGRSMRSFIPFRQSDEWRMRFYYPPKHAYDFYLPIMQVEKCIEYHTMQELRADLEAWKPDAILVNQPLDLPWPERQGFLFHGIPWASGRRGLMVQIGVWRKWCNYFFCSHDEFANELRARPSMDGTQTTAPGLVQNDYILSLNKEAMRAKFLETHGLPKDAYIILFVDNFNASFAPLTEHQILLRWLMEYVSRNAKTYLVVKPKSANLKPQNEHSRIFWAHKNQMLYDCFFADVIVSLPVGTHLADACIADIPLIMATPKAAKSILLSIADEMRAVEYNVGPVVQDKATLFSAIEQLQANPQTFADGRLQYLQMLYPGRLDGLIWGRVLSTYKN